MTDTIVARGVACIDCTMGIANGEWPDPDTDFNWTVQRVIASQKTFQNYSVTLGHLHTGDNCYHADEPCEEDCDCERTTFSNEACSICDSQLAGSRHDVTFWETTDYDALRERFPWIVKWCDHMGSFDYYLRDQLVRADQDNAPSNVIYRSENAVFAHADTKVGKHWQTTGDIENPELIQKWNLWTPAQRAKAQSLCARFGVEFDESNFLHHSYESSMMAGYVEGWIGHHIYVGIEPNGDSHS